MSIEEKLPQEFQDIERIEKYLYHGQYTSAMYWIDQLPVEKRPALYAGAAIAVAYAHDRLASSVHEREAALSKGLLAQICNDLAQKSGYIKETL